MTDSRVSDIEREVARMRVLLSVAAMLSAYVDPNPPMLTRWEAPRSGVFVIAPLTFAVLCAHLLYGFSVSWTLERRKDVGARFFKACAVSDVVFATAIAHVTDGTTSPSLVFFLFAILNAGLRGEMRQALWITAASVGAYLALILAAHPSTAQLFVMRPASLAIMGYLTVHLAHQRVAFEAELRELQAVAERQRVARSLHDGYVQALAGVALRLEASRELLRRQQPDAAFAEISELQSRVKQEHASVRTFLRSLLGLRLTPSEVDSRPPASLTVQIDMATTPRLAEEVLQIALEGIRNVTRHAHATTAEVRATVANDGAIAIRIADDGVGFTSEAAHPWSILSRVKEVGGQLDIQSGSAGATLSIEIPPQ